MGELAPAPATVDKNPARPKPPKPPESPFKKDMEPKERQQAELRHVSHVILRQEGEKINNPELDSAEEAVKDLQRLISLPSADFTETQETSNGLDVKDKTTNTDGSASSTPAIKVQTDQGEKGIEYIAKADDGFFYCKLEGWTEGQELFKIKRTDFIDSYLKLKGELVISHFPDGPQKTMLRAYLASLNGETDSPLLKEDVINQTIKEAAESANILTVDTLKTLVYHEFPEHTLTTGQTALTEEQLKANVKRNEKIAETLKLIEGKNIADADTAMQVFEAVGYNQSSLIDTANQYDAQAKALGEKHGDAAKEQITDLRTKARLYKEASAQMGQDGVIHDALLNMEHGQLKNADKIIKGIKENNIESVLEAMVDLPEEKKKALTSLIKAGKFSLLGVILVLLIGHEAAGFLQGNSQR